MKQKLPEIVLSNFKPKSSKDPYSLFFVYPKNNEPFVLKGRSGECKTYIEQRFPHCVYYYTFWFNKTCRGRWGAPKNLKIYFTKIKRKYQVTIFKDRCKIYQANFRSIPHKWIDVYDLAITGT